MFLKLIGSLLFILMTSMIGLACADRFQKRIFELRQLIELVDKMKGHLRFRVTPTQQMIRELSESSSFQSLIFLNECAERLTEEKNFPEVWKQCFLQAKDSMHLERQDIDAVLSIGDTLGSSEAGAQISSLELVESLLKSNLEEAVEEKRCKGKLYRNLGVLSGIAVSILIL